MNVIGSAKKLCNALLTLAKTHSVKAYLFVSFEIEMVVFFVKVEA